MLANITMYSDGILETRTRPENHTQPYKEVLLRFIFNSILSLSLFLLSPRECHNKTSSPEGNDRSPESKKVYLNSSLVSKRFFSIGQGQLTPQSGQISNSLETIYFSCYLQEWRR